MPRYFFNMVEDQGKKVVRDSAGTMLSSVRAARKEAVGLARDVAGHGLRGLSETWKVVVTDEEGTQVLSIALSDIRGARLRAWLGLGSRFPKLGAAATHRLLAMVLAGAVLAALLGSRPTVDVVTLPAGFEPAAAPADAAVVSVRFTPSARAEEITALLASYKASIVDGPRNGGMYRLQLGEATKPEDVAEVARRLANEPVVELVAVVQ